MRRVELHLDEDLDILIHWLELNLNRRLTSRIYRTNPMPVTYRDWKMLAELLDAQQRRLDGIIREQNASRPVPTQLPHFVPVPPRPPQVLFCPAPVYPPRAPNPQAQQQCLAPQILPCPAGAGDRMIVDQARAPAAPRSCFRCGQVGHIARNCHLPDTRPNVPRPQVRAANEEEWNAEDYQNELALLRDRLAIYERERMLADAQVTQQQQQQQPSAAREQQDFGEEVR